MSGLGRRGLLLAPLGVAALGGAAFWTLLRRMRTGSFDPRGLPSKLIGERVPKFSLPGQTSSEGFTDRDLAGPALVNFFASWCAPCIIEAPELMRLKQAGVPIWGIAYKDAAEKTAEFLRQNGDPYVRVARDEPGRVAIDFGVFGVPETYAVDHQGVIRWRWAGPLTPDVMQRQLQPLWRSLA